MSKRQLMQSRFCSEKTDKMKSKIHKIAVVEFQDDDPECNIEYVEIDRFEGHFHGKEWAEGDEVIVNWFDNERYAAKVLKLGSSKPELKPFMDQLLKGECLKTPMLGRGKRDKKYNSRLYSSDDDDLGLNEEQDAAKRRKESKKLSKNGKKKAQQSLFNDIMVRSKDGDAADTSSEESDVDLTNTAMRDRISVLTAENRQLRAKNNQLVRDLRAVTSLENMVVEYKTVLTNLKGLVPKKTNDVILPVIKSSTPKPAAQGHHPLSSTPNDFEMSKSSTSPSPVVIKSSTHKPAAQGHPLSSTPKDCEISKSSTSPSPIVIKSSTHKPAAQGHHLSSTPKDSPSLSPKSTKKSDKWSGATAIIDLVQASRLEIVRKCSDKWRKYVSNLLAAIYTREEMAGLSLTGDNSEKPAMSPTVASILREHVREMFKDIDVHSVNDAITQKFQNEYKAWKKATSHSKAKTPVEE